MWDGFDGRAGGAPDFARYNLLYGWNASGKTTLSRVFALFTPSGSPRLPLGARARIRVGEDVLDSQKDQDRTRFPVCIFNRDFIDTNLQREDYTRAPALFIVGADNIRLSNRIAMLTKRRERVATMYRAAKKAQDEATTAREKAATDLARECGNVLGIRNFRAPDLRALAQKTGSPAAHVLDEAALDAAITQARDQSVLKPILSTLLALPSRLPMPQDIEGLLAKTPQQTAIKRLTDHPALSNWIRAGLGFHEHTTHCAFCGGDAKQALEAYARHFSDEYRQQDAAISAAITQLQQPRPAPVIPHEREWSPQVWPKVTAALTNYQSWEQRENQIHAAWLDLLRQKIENMESSIAVDAVEDRLPGLTAIVAQLNQAKEEHNLACNEMATRRQASSDAVKAHFAARFIHDPGAAELVEKLDRAGDKLGRVTGVGQRVALGLEAANTELQRSSVAASEINGHLRRLLGTRLSVEQAQDGRLQFMREGTPATNMSDGERTAISLSYFLVSLRQRGQLLSDTIVFVDDPICSLDANHIYDVSSLLTTLLIECKQAFVSTHNSEFFNAIKQTWTDRTKFKKDHAGFLIHRPATGHSQLSALPSHLVRFRSDYHHVFYCLRQILANESQDVDDYIHCPNLVRRFLEMYLGFRKPAASGYQAKLDALFDDAALSAAVARYADEGSHSVSTLRLLEFSDFPAMSRGMVERVFSALEAKDPMHHAALMEATE